MAADTEPYQLQQIYNKAMETIAHSPGIVIDANVADRAMSSYPWQPNIVTSPPWVDSTTSGYPHAMPYTPPPQPLNPMLPVGPLSPSGLGPALGGGIFSGGNYKPEPTLAELKELLGNYRFLIKSIRSLANAGKLNPEIALQAIDALLMALDDNYDKLDAQAAAK